MSALSPADAALFETSVVPRYLAMFAEPLLAMIAAGGDARVCHVACRTGFPDVELFERLPDAHLYGCDASSHAIELAKAKTRAKAGMVAEYRVVERLPMPFPRAAFSHAFALCPPFERRKVLEELARLVAGRGQALLAMPLAGSFGELEDLLRECALKMEIPALLGAVDAVSQQRPTEQALAAELGAAGFEYVEVKGTPRAIAFSSGRDFVDDPIARLVLLPELRASLGLTDDAAFGYVREAIDKYWSDGSFELTVQVGVASGRRK